MARPKTVCTPLVTAQVSIDVAEVAAGSTLVVTKTVLGLRKGHPVVAWTEAALNAGLSIGNFHCSAKDELKFRVMNATAAPINPAAMNYSVVQF